jgi:outer membrane protein assembly factor BamB
MPVAHLRLRASVRWIVPALAAITVSLPGCEEDGANGPSGTGGTSVSGVSVAASERVGLSTVVSLTTSLVDSVRVRATDPDGEEHVTPFRAVTSGERQIAVLGLRAATTYTHTIEAMGVDGTVTTDAGTATTAPLPDALADVELRIDTGPGPDGDLFTGLRTGYLVAFGPTGRLIWYLEVDGFLGRFAGVAPTGNFIAFVGSSRGWEPTFGYYLEITPSGEVVARYQADAPYYTDNHELLLTVDETGGVSSHLFGYTLRPVDMQALFPPDGNPDAEVAGHQILRHDPSGRLDFLFDAWDHLEVSDWDVANPVPENCGVCDFDHPNSLDLDADGNYVASFRTLNEITAIDRRTGSLLWRFGGRNNQFTVIGDPLGGFSGQHSARMVGPDRLLLFDNGPNHVPTLSRAVEYELDLDAMTATLVWEYRPSPSLYSAFQCFVQRLSNGHTLVGFSAQAEVHVVDEAGEAVWKGTVVAPDGAGRFYRIHAIGSIYDPAG